MMSLLLSILSFISVAYSGSTQGYCWNSQTKLPSKDSCKEQFSPCGGGGGFCWVVQNNPAESSKSGSHVKAVTVTDSKVKQYILDYMNAERGLWGAGRVVWSDFLALNVATTRAGAGCEGSAHFTFGGGGEIMKHFPSDTNIHDYIINGGGRGAWVQSKPQLCNGKQSSHYGIMVGTGWTHVGCAATTNCRGLGGGKKWWNKYACQFWGKKPKDTWNTIQAKGKKVCNTPAPPVTVPTYPSSSPSPNPSPNPSPSPPACTWNGWTNSGSCSKTCGAGTQIQRRTRKTGSCPTQTRTVSCNRGTCSTNSGFKCSSHRECGKRSDGKKDNFCSSSSGRCYCYDVDSRDKWRSSKCPPATASAEASDLSTETVNNPNLSLLDGNDAADFHHQQQQIFFVKEDDNTQTIAVVALTLSAIAFVLILVLGLTLFRGRSNKAESF